MAFLNPFALLYHRQHSAHLFRNLAPVGRVLCSSTSTDEPSKASGPVRYVRKPLLDNGANSREELFRGKGTDGETKADEKKGYRMTSRQFRGTGTKSFNNRNTSQASLAIVPSAYQSKSVMQSESSNNQAEQESGEDIAEPGLVFEHSRLRAGNVSILRKDDSGGGRYTLRACVEESKAEKSRGKPTDDDVSSLARNYAITLLARGPQIESNLRSKLMKRKIPPEIIDETIEELQRCGLQSDTEYTEVFARSRWKDNTWGPLRIKYELVRRGVSKETVEAGLCNLFQRSDNVGGNLEEEDSGKWGMSTEASEHLINRAQQRWAQGDVEINVRRRRLTGWLQRRGFSWSIIVEILKIVESKGSAAFE